MKIEKINIDLGEKTKTNKLLQRVENGDARQMVKLLAGISLKTK